MWYGLSKVSPAFRKHLFNSSVCDGSSSEILSGEEKDDDNDDDGEDGDGIEECNEECLELETKLIGKLSANNPCTVYVAGYPSG